VRGRRAMDIGLDRFTAKWNFDGFGMLHPNVRLAVGPIAMVIVFSAYWFLGYTPKQQVLLSVQAQQRELQGKLAEVRSVVSNLPQFQEEVENLQGQLTVALKQLPIGRELPSLLTDISSLGLQSGLEIGLFEPQNEKPRTFYAEVPISLEFEGEYHATATFFGKIARLSRIVNVNDISMKIKQASIDSTRLSVKGTITTFRFIEGGGA